jgi:MFS family permease
VLLGGATALLPVYAKDILHAGPWALGLLRAAPACGAILMSLVLTHHSLRGPIGLQLFAALFVFGLATVAFGLSTSIPLSILSLAVLGAADSISMVVRGSLVPLHTPDEMLGRVSAVNTLFIGTSNQLGEFESGVTAALMGTVPAAVVGGLGTIAVAALGNLASGPPHKSNVLCAASIEAILGALRNSSGTDPKSLVFKSGPDMTAASNSAWRG